MTQTHIQESPISMVEGETITYSIAWLGASSLSSPGAIVYIGGSDESATAMPSGTHTVSGNVQTLKPIVAGSSDGGKVFVVAISCVVDGNTEIRKLLINILKDESEA